MAVDDELASGVGNAPEATLDQPDDDYLTELDDASEPPNFSSLSQTDIDINKAAFYNHIISHSNDRESSRAGRQAKTAESNRIIDQAREYQQELFEKAKDENVIAVLDTGSGKTLIAALLIRHYLQEEILSRSKGSPAKIVFFLVNSVHLARQQARFLSVNLPQKVISLFGDTSDDLWRKAEWTRIFAENSVVVCTAAVLDSCLFHSYLTIGQISLLIFDEAHHCKKNHPYSRIIRDYYLKWKGDRPRIFGMTASPIDSRRDIAKVVSDLEALLHSKIITTSDLSVFAFAPRAKDVKWIYPQLDAQFETKLYSALMPLCGFVDDLEPFFRFAYAASKNLGSWAADRVWKYAIPTAEHEAAKIVRKYERSDAYTRITDPERREVVLAQIEAAASIVQAHNFAPPVVDADGELSPKVRKLYDELVDRASISSTTRSIVFVEERITAVVLCDLFASLNLPNLRPGVLVGVAQTGKGGGSWKDQEAIMENFRSGIINFIFATSVAEEGIDIPQCNLVVRFDLYKTPIQYMQSRGRARMVDSIFAHMIEENNQSHEADVNYAIEQDEYITNFCKNLPADRLLGQGSMLKQLMAKDASCPSFATSTGVVANFANSLVLLKRYSETLRKIGATHAEVYQEMIGVEDNLFQYKVTLPDTDDERSTAVKGARGEARTNKVLAKRSAAWNCLCKLRQAGLLDENLDSIFFKVRPANANERSAVSEKKNDYEKKVKPSFWVDSGATSSTLPLKLFVTHVRITPSSDLTGSDGILLLSRMPLPKCPGFPIYVDNNVERGVSFEHCPQPLPVTPEQIDAITTYTLNGIFHDIFNKQFAHSPSSMSYWLVPPAKMRKPGSFEGMVNMEELSAAAAAESAKWDSSAPTPESVKRWSNAFLVDPGSGKFRYFTEDVVPGKTIFDAIPDSARSVKKKYDSTIIEYSDSTFRAKTKDFEKEIKLKYDPSQLVFNAKVIVAGRNYVEKCSEEDQRFAICHIAPQPLRLARISASVAQTCILWPSILHRLEGYLIVQEAFKKLDLEDVPLTLALEAFTQSCSTDGFELGSEIGSQIGPDIDQQLAITQDGKGGHELRATRIHRRLASQDDDHHYRIQPHDM